MHKTVVINVVGLTKKVLAKAPFLHNWSKKAETSVIKPTLPAVTCTAQATYLTGKYADQHGIVGNGWYFDEECEIKFWRQSNKLLQAEKIWEHAKRIDPNFTCANLFWWYNMYSDADYTVTPRPMYPADGRKMPDIYTNPPSLRATLQKELGQFPLFNFWGPATSIRASKWIADASIILDKMHNAALTLIYLPHLDYNFQRFGPDDPRCNRDIIEIDKECEKLIKYFEEKGAKVLLLSEYGITAVNNSISINKTLRKHGFLEIREEMGLELLDAGASKAFAVADHQLAHIYVKNKESTNEIKDLVSQIEGVEDVSKREDIKLLNHQRSGELIAIADQNSWFNYYYWLDEKKAPDFARTIDIHRKPGYDPVELFFDQDKKFIKPYITYKLLKKKLGFRDLLDVVPLKPELVKGSHGRVPENISDYPILISKNIGQNLRIEAHNVYEIILNSLVNP